MFKYLTFCLLVGDAVISQICPFTTYEDALINDITPIQLTQMTIGDLDASNGDSIGFGFWLQCIPLWTVKQYENVQSPYDNMQGEQGQLVFLMKSDLGNKIVYSVIFDATQPSITHQILLDDGQVIQNTYPNLEYEGIWIFTYFTYQPSAQQLIIEMTGQNNQMVVFTLPNDDYTLIVGGRGQITINQVVFNLNFYRGRLSKLINENQYFYDQNHFNTIALLCSIPPKVVGEQTQLLVQGLQLYTGDTMSTFQIDQVGNRYVISGWVKCDTSKMIDSMTMVFIRITAFQDYSNSVYLGDELYRVTYFISEMMSYMQVQVNQYNIPLIGTQPFAETQLGPFNQYIDNQNPNFLMYEAIQQWHFFQYEYGRTTIWRSLLKIKFIDSIEPIEFPFGDGVYQGSFTNSIFYVLLCGDSYFLQEQFQGYLQNIKINYNYQDDKDFVLSCHYSCLECSGPLATNCISCTPGSNRVFLPEQSVCKCIYKYLDIQDQNKCTAFSDAYSTVQEKENEDSNSVICPFGYFYVPIGSNGYECVQCPQNQSSYIICVDCLFYPSTWYLNPKCTQDLVPQIVQEGNAYSLVTNNQLDFDFFLIDVNNNPQLYPGIQDFCQQDTTNCHSTKLTHLGEVISIICKVNHYFLNDNCHLPDYQCILVDDTGLCTQCKQGYYLFQNQCEVCPILCPNCHYKDAILCLSCNEGYALTNGECLPCGKNCKICDYFYDDILNNYYLRCFKCLDNYFLTLDAINCIINIIQYCQIPFQVLADDYTTNTLDYYFLPQTTDNVLNFCAVCDPAFYVFVISSQTCQAGYLTGECTFAIALMDNFDVSQEICIVSPGIPSMIPIQFSIGCQTQNTYCDTCIEGKQESSFECLICEAGYYSQRLTGVCQQCPVDLQCQQCYQQDKYRKDHWKIFGSAFYRYIINSDYKHSFTVHAQSQNSDDYEIVCSSCQSGYELYQDVCILACPTSCQECLLIGGQEVCIKCPSDEYGRQLSLSNNECIVCPSYCALCRVRSQTEIQNINPQFSSLDFEYSTYQCLKPYIDLYYDQYLGQYINCEVHEISCSKKFDIEMNLYCSYSEYQQDMDQSSDSTRFKQQNIYINDLFTTTHSNFNEFEQFNFYYNANEQKIKTIDIKIISRKAQNCSITGDQVITQLFSSNIFSAMQLFYQFSNVMISFIGEQNTNFQFDRTVTFSNFTSVQFQGIIFQPIANTRNKQIVFNSSFIQTVTLSQSGYEQLNSDYDLCSITINNAKTITITDFQIINLKQTNVTTFFIINGAESLQQIQITGLNIQSAYLSNTDVLQINTNNKNIEVNLDTINVEACVFTNSKLLNVDTSISEAKLNIQQISIKSQVISTSGFLNIVQFAVATINGFLLSNSDIINSLILKLGNKAIVTSFTTINSQITSSILILNSENYYTTSIDLLFEDLKLQTNSYDETTKFLQIDKQTTAAQQLTFQRFSMIGNWITSLSDENILTRYDIALVYIYVDNISVIDLVIERGVGLPEISFVNSGALVVGGLYITQNSKFIFRSVHKYLDCLLKYLKVNYYPPSIYVYQSDNTIIQNLNIKSAYTYNYPLISFNFPELSSQSLNIRIENGLIIQNFLLIARQLVEMAIIDVQSQQSINIILDNLTFQGNVLHEYIQSELLDSGTLININCILCYVEIVNSVFDSNLVLNSTDSIMHLKAKSIKIDNSQFKYNTQFQYDIIKPFLIWGIIEQEPVTLESIMEVFQILSLSGNGVLLSEKIIIRNSVISNSKGSQGGAFNIVPQNIAYFECSNTQIIQIQTFFTQGLESGGALNIDASYSSSSVLLLKNLTLSSIFSRASGGILYIVNGEGAVSIQLIDLQISNSYAKLGSIIYCAFQSTSTEPQTLLIDGIVLQNSLDMQAKFLSTFTGLQKQEMTQILNDRTLIYVEYGTSVNLQNLLIQQLNYESLIQASSIKRIIMEQIKVYNCTFPLLLFNIIPIANYQFTMAIDGLQIQDAIQLQLDNLFENCVVDTISVVAAQFQCVDISSQIPPNALPKLSNNNSQAIQNCLNQTVISTDTQTGIISVQDLNLVQYISISNVKLHRIDCNSCYQGLISLIHLPETTIAINIKFTSIKIRDSLCGYSSCVILSKGTVINRLLDELQSAIWMQNYDIYIKYYICTNNTAAYGTCLTIQSFSAVLDNCLFESNTATNQGGALYLNQVNNYIIDSSMTNNSATVGGAISNSLVMSDLLKQRTEIKNNKASFYGNDISSIPTQLQISINKTQGFLDTYTIEESNTHLIEGIQNSKYIIYLPSGQAIGDYYYFDWESRSYKYPGLQFRIAALDQQQINQQNLTSDYCTINSRLLNLTGNASEFTNNLTNIKQIYFSNQTQDFNLDSLTLIFDYEQPKEIVIQLELWCSPIEVPIFNTKMPYNLLSTHNNYYLRVNIRTLPCTYGEIKSSNDQSCYKCDSVQDQFSLTINAVKCEIKDDLTVESITSAQLKLKTQYWRPYFDTSAITYCLNLPSNCQGGWIEGDTSCIEGHIGALCEQCDLYNSRGSGEFAYSQKYTCGPCSQKSMNVAIMIGTIIWTFFSLILSVKSTLTTVEKHLKQTQTRMIGLTVYYRIAQSGVLIKMFTNYLQIIASLTTFQLQLPLQIDNVINTFGNPNQAISYSQDCILHSIANIHIHYLRMIWQIFLPFFFFSAFFFLYAIAVRAGKIKFNLTVITTSIIYLFLYFQPNIVNGLIQLISFREISGFKWIQNNVAFRYDTNQHYQWILKFCLPILIILAFLIPLFILYGLYNNRNNLNNKRTKLKWGYLYNEYKLTSYFWEVVKIFEKDLIIIALVYYEDDVVVKGILVIFIVQIYQELNSYYRPYQLNKFNQLDLYTANISKISFTLGVGIYMAYQHQITFIQTLFFVLIGIFNVSLIVVVIWRILQAYAVEMEEFFDSMRGWLLIKWPSRCKTPAVIKLLENSSQRRRRVEQNFFKIKCYLIPVARSIIACKQDEILYSQARSTLQNQASHRTIMTNRSEGDLLIIPGNMNLKMSQFQQQDIQKSKQ